VPPEIGSTAPAFALPSTGGTASLAAHRGERNVLLAFFPLAFTSTCTAELCAFTDDYSRFESKDVAVIPISVDAVPSLKEFKAKHDIAVDLASDFKREVSRAYGVLNPEKFYANRAYFLIDRAGVIRWSHVEGNNSDRRENADLFAAIATLA
jgi:peroxiredoxin